MSSAVLSCGVGAWSGPLPGDPDNNALISATPAFGGVDVSWTFPSTNPHAVAHTRLYRGLDSVFENAVLLTIAAGNFHYDKNITGAVTLYYYWIEIVSVNGTVGEVIGPASAAAKPTIGSMIEVLTGQIDSGLLASALSLDIGKIALNYDELMGKVSDLADGDSALGDALAQLQSGLTDSVSLITTEATQRQSGQSVLTGRIDALASANNSSMALVWNEFETMVDADEANAANIALLATATGENAAAVLEETQARTTRDLALASQITTAQGNLEGMIASAETALDVKIDGLTGSVDAMYTARVDVNGLIGGFGIHNDGHTVDAGFDVDTFWVGRTTNKIKPFIIAADPVTAVQTVYISEAAIEKLTFSKLRDEAGAFIVENGKIKADALSGTDLKITGGDFTGWAWPASGDGFYLGEEGLLLGNHNTGDYLALGRDGTISSRYMVLDTSGLAIGNGFKVDTSGKVTADLIDILRRTVLATGLITPSVHISGRISGSVGSGGSDWLPIGTVKKGEIDEIVITDVYDMDTQSVSANQPYYVAAHVVAGPPRDVENDNGMKMSIHIFPEVTSIRQVESTNASLNGHTWTVQGRLSIKFEYMIQMHQGHIGSFRLPDVEWTLYAI